MKKNGFTLIEIIGAIVILGIIAIIAFATYTRSLGEFRNSYYSREVKTMEKVAEEFFTDNRNYRPTKVLNAQEVLVSTLVAQGYVDKIVDYNGDNCSDTSYVIVAKEGQDEYSYHACLICEKDEFDNTNEDIYCDKSWLDPTKVEYGIGELEKTYVYKGTTREDLKEELELPISYIRKDNNGNVLAERRGTKEGHENIYPIDLDLIDTNTVGNYKVTYKYGEEKSQRDVEVYENSAPTVSYKKENTILTSLSEDTSTSQETYTSGEWAQNVIVKLESQGYVQNNNDFAIAKFQWNVDGRWEDFCEGDSCEVKVTREMNQIVQFRSIDVNGHISITTESVQMKIDNTSPRCSLTIPTTKGENDWYKTNVEITFNEKVDQKSSNDNSLVSGIKNYNIQKSTDSIVKAATIDTNTHSQDTSGVTYKGFVEDKAGNYGLCEVTFKRDATAPTCTFGTIDQIDVTKEKVLKLTCTDTLSGLNNRTITTSDFTLSNNKVSIKSVSQKSVTNGIEISTTLHGESDGESTIQFKSNSLNDNASNGNNSVSQSITINGKFKVTLNNQSATTAGTGAIYELYGTGWYSNSNMTTSISSITNPTKNGYVFGGYYTSKKGEGTQIINSSGTIKSGKESSFTSATTLYAKWTECGTGYYCTGEEKIPCPPGTYGTGTTTGATQSESCKDCGSGAWCPGGNERIECSSVNLCSTGATNATTQSEGCKACYEWLNSCTNYNWDCKNDCSRDACLWRCEHRFGVAPLDVSCGNRSGYNNTSDWPWNGYCWCKYKTGVVTKNRKCDTSGDTVQC